METLGCSVQAERGSFIEPLNWTGFITCRFPARYLLPVKTSLKAHAVPASSYSFANG